jgi:hypothetical protein
MTFECASNGLAAQIAAIWIKIRRMNAFALASRSRRTATTPCCQMPIGLYREGHVKTSENQKIAGGGAQRGADALEGKPDAASGPAYSLPGTA